MIVVLNNKCNFTKEEFDKYHNQINKIKTSNRLIICPSNLYLSSCRLENIKLGSQNVSKYKNGSHTGEISARQLKSVGVEYTIVGHYERKKEFNETVNDEKLKIKNLLNESIIPIICVGETKEERLNGDYRKIIIKQIDATLEDLPEKEKDKIIIAYEPIWSIGRGIIPSKDQLEEIIYYIKEQYPNNFVLYGGSITDDNIYILKDTNGIDGFLLGIASLNVEKIEKFTKIIEK